MCVAYCLNPLLIFHIEEGLRTQILLADVNLDYIRHIHLVSIHNGI